MEIVSNIALVSINETVFVQLISFLIFLYIMNRVMFRPLRDTMLKRNHHVKRIQDDITHQENQLQTLKNKISEGESRVRSEALEMRKKLEDSGSREAAAIISTTRQEIGVLRKKSAQDVDKKVSEARKSLQQESEGLVLDVMEKVLDRRPSP